MPERPGPGAGSVVAAELLKLRSLPAVSVTIATTAVLTGLLTLAVSASDGAAIPPLAVVAQVMQYGQIGVVLVGLLAATSEYDDRQIVTSLISVPQRLLLAGAKAIACVVAVTVASALTVAAAHLAVVNRFADTPGTDIATGAVGSICYLTLLAMFGHGVGLLLRGTIPTLIVILLLAYVASPLLGRVGDYLPGKAGSQLYQSTPTVGLSTVVLVAWAVATLLAATTLFLRRDAA
ncbi:hypothetical protein Kfla_2110 [Kribbella flavida DSM 17836]|uniref:ABC transporter permease n=1 Tax=Kribbella flavida (strain DSM 17836 / JCM 10339 / NBRC 14399) TaxID=479435 RepID=D2PS68_KRIFD|nr:ABC transporter permease [Kribbella flavida]ADB31192.1 hypothetical protein Kfla_2110 [Kribbella flavida DSM 17836]